MRTLWLLTVILMAMTAGVAGAQEPAELELFLTYIPNVQYAPVYVALERGYFAEAGLDVRIRHGAEHDGVDLVAANQLQVGIFGGEQVLLARAQGRPVVSVYEWFQRFPAGLLARDDAAGDGVAGFGDLAGRRVGIHGRSGVTWSALVALMSDAGLSEADFALETVGFNVPELICLGRIDAAVVYLNNEPLQVRERIRAEDCGETRAVRVFAASEVADLVSNGVVTNEATIAERPELIAAFVAAFDRGLREAIANPAAAMLASAAHVEGLIAAERLGWWQARAADEDAPELTMGDAAGAGALIQYEVLLATIPFWEAEVPGFSEREAWITTAETLEMAGMLERAPEIDGAFTNDFLPDGRRGESASQ